MPTPALASGWSVIRQSILSFARDVAVSYAADGASRLLGKGEVEKLKVRLEELQKQVTSHYGTAPSTEYHEAVKLLQESKIKLEKDDARVTR